MITVWQAVVLAIIQGIAEFLPISSTAHLILVPWLFHWPDPGLTFDVALHAGTLAAVIGFFFTTWVRIIRAGFGEAIDIHTGERIGGAALASQRRLLWFLVLATIPGGVIGLLFDKQIETTWRNPLIIAASLIVVGLIMGWADRKPAQTKDYDDVSIWDALWIGLAQAAAVIPGVSRSGSTITAGLFTGMTREAAARFSFLLATPIIGGAVLDKFHELHKTGIPAGMAAPFAVGIAVSAVVGIASIALFIRFLKLSTLRFFVWYRVILGLVVIALFFAGLRSY
ncbi:MAG TPA: undecaprenyl-diphosphate phosphatase [Terriglobales bacterium]|nr:undecaprenyl-diphosphate phosphatase [Terriglobales bacterium]